MFDELTMLTTRPSPFSRGTAADLWTDPHVARQMLQVHLDPEIDAASRNHAFIDRSARWLAKEFDLGRGRRILDLGCGPGLYAQRLAATGAQVHGVDISDVAITYARQIATRAGHDITYTIGDYRAGLPQGPFDLVTMIMCDYCVLSPKDRENLLASIASVLAPNGAFVFDAYAGAFGASRVDGVDFAPNLMDGFWSDSPYFGFLATFVYPEDRVVLDRYLIVEDEAIKEVFNWLQWFTQDRLARELATSGLEPTWFGSVAGDPYDPDAQELAVVARRS